MFCYRRIALSVRRKLTNIGFTKHLVIIALASMAATRFAQAQYTFGPQVQSTNTASITYNSGTGVFQYTDTSNLSADFAGLILTGNAATFITTTNGWTASLAVNLSARSMPGNSSEVHAAMGLYVVVNGNYNNTVQIILKQDNATGDSGARDLYGAMTAFEAVTNNQNLATTPLGGSSDNDGISYQQLSGGTNDLPTTESINAASGVLTLTNDALTDTLTGYYNGTPVGSISLASWGPNPSLLLAVVGFSAYGINVPAGTDTASNFFAGPYLAVTTVSLPNATNNVAYNQMLAAFGGQTPYSWTDNSGTLPTGLTLANNGVLSGTPTTNGTFNFTVQVADATNSKATQPLTLTVGSPPRVALQPTNSSVALTVESNVSFSVSVTGTGPFSYQWQLDGTNLPNDIITTVAGNGTNGYSGDRGAATNAELSAPNGMVVDATGNVFIADTANQRIRKVGTNGIISTVAGNGIYGPSGDGGAATNAELGYPSGVAVDATGNLFIADSENERIREVGTNGIITTVAGNGYGANTIFGGFAGDGGQATNAEFWAPHGLAVDATGNLFIVDTENERIREVGTNGIITTVAGNGTPGFSGDGSPATNAELYNPYRVAVDTTGNLFIADTLNNRIREVETNGIITTVAGNGTPGYYGDGSPAINAELYNPFGVGVDATGNLFIADDQNNRIREVGTNGIVITVAGNGTHGYSGDGGVATNAELSDPGGVSVDTTGNLFIADFDNNRIRKVINPGFAFTGPALALEDVGFGNAGAYDVVVTGPYGSVTSSVVNLVITLPVVLSEPQMAAGKTIFTFLLSGPAGSNYVLQVSTNLLNWSSVSTSTIPVGGAISLSNVISGYNRRFYQVYLP
jgi:sugar lactone lactonase YvrE